MKRLIFFLLAMGGAFSLSAQVRMPEYTFATGNSSGSWSIVNGRALQSDQTARLAKVNVRAHQSGAMVYDFNARYEGGSENGHGGFGIHVFVDSVIHRVSWGSGKSYLLWLNYDENPLPNSRIPVGLSGQVYRSRSNTQMDLIHSVDLNQYAYLLTPENLAQPIHFKIWVNGDTGEVRILDPTDPYLSTYYYFNIPQADLPMKGEWVSLRSNGLKISFAPEE